jgi:hypothetical protein
MTVVSAINQASPNWSSYGHLVKDIKVLAQSVHWVEINYAPNLHSLDELWMVECLFYIQSIIFTEQVSSL